MRLNHRFYDLFWQFHLPINVCKSKNMQKSNMKLNGTRQLRFLSTIFCASFYNQAVFFFRDLVDVLSERDKILFSEIAVPGRLKRKIAARAFFYTLGMHVSIIWLRGCELTVKRRSRAVENFENDRLLNKTAQQQSTHVRGSFDISLCKNTRGRDQKRW